MDCLTLQRQIIDKLTDVKNAVNSNPKQLDKAMLDLAEIGPKLIELSSTALSKKKNLTGINDVNELMKQILKGLPLPNAKMAKVNPSPAEIQILQNEHLIRNHIKYIFEEFQLPLSDKSWEIFKRLHRRRYGRLALYLHESLISNTLNIFKKASGCDKQIMGIHCVSSLVYIDQGLILEGYYISWKNLTRYTKEFVSTWENKMEDVVLICQNEISECN